MTMNRFAAFGDNGGMPEACDKARKSYRKTLTDFFERELNGASVEDMKKAIEAIGEARKPTKPKSRLANKKPLADEDEDGVIPSLDKGHTMTDDINRGPWHAMLDRQALALQAQTGESYASAFTKAYTDPSNRSIVDQARFEHLAQGEDAISGTKLSAIPTQKARAPADALQDDVDPGSAEYELHSRTITRMKNEPGISYQRAFTREYLAPENRSLKDRVTSEGIQRMQAQAPAKPFPAYGNPGDVDYKNPNMGRSGAKPKGWAGG